MAVNFVDPKCITDTNERIFGICDDPPPSKAPAYLDFADGEKWIVWVENDEQKNVAFTAIDHCVEIRRLDGSLESSCDGMLQYDNAIVFVELKDRDGGRWLGKARDQLQITIDTYKAHVGLGDFSRYYAFIANKQRPYFNAANPALKEKFEDETGFLLIVDHVIKIE